MDNQKYHIFARILHWGMAIIIIGLLISGLTKPSWPKDIQPHFYFWHKSFGMLVVFLFIARVLVKIFTKEPELPKELGKSPIFAAKIGWSILYMFMIAMPLSGYIASDAGGYPVPFFGLNIPDLISENKSLDKTVWFFHENLPRFFVIMIMLHVLAAVKHYYFDKINLFKKMF